MPSKVSREVIRGPASAGSRTVMRVLLTERRLALLRTKRML
jgi:hypothetical protein